MNGKEILKILKQHGWFLRRVCGSHHIVSKAGHRNVSVPLHGSKDLPKGTLHAIEKQTGVKL